MAILKFEGTKRYLSNFWPCLVEYEALIYPSSEHAFQAAKTLDLQERLIIANLPRPFAAKSAGRKIELRSDWGDVRLQVMYEIVLDKFTRHPVLTAKLLDTGVQNLVEGNHWNDTYWGVCRGKGSNHLGIILMRVRREIA